MASPDLTPVWCAHPTDTSRLLLGLLTFCRTSTEQPAGRLAPLGGVIAPAVLKTLLTALHLRDPDTVHHVRRTAALASALADRLRFEERQLKVVEVACLLHEIGKIGVPDNVLFKPGALSPDEQELFRLNYRVGSTVLQACRVAPEVLEILTEARTHFGGAGEGFQRIGNDLSLGGRILAVADAYDSLRSCQPYRPGLPHSEALGTLQDAAGRRFDGTIVETLGRLEQEVGLPITYTGNEHPEHTLQLNPSDALQAGAICNIFSYLYLLETMYDGFYIVDSDLRYAVWNRGLQGLLGWSPVDMLGQRWSSQRPAWASTDRMPMTDAVCPLTQVFTSGRRMTTLVELQQANGDWRAVEVQTIPLLDQRRRVCGVAEIFRDAHRIGQKQGDNPNLRAAATIDALTGVVNRGEFNRQLDILVEQQGRNVTEPFSVIFCDVDLFKSVNDSFGHSIGDLVLVHLARLLQQELYSGEIIGRYGGEEFVVLCPQTVLDDAVARAERIRLAVMKLELGELKGRKLTISSGVAQFSDGDAQDSVVRRADEALYHSKRNGRNQTTAFTIERVLEKQQAEAPPQEAVKVDPLLFTNEFSAVLTAEMVVYKLAGFVEEHRAKVKQVSAQTTVLRIGHAGWFSTWGSQESQQPVELTLEFGKPEESRKVASSSPRCRVKVTVKPQGRVLPVELFQPRAQSLFKALRASFAADE